MGKILSFLLVVLALLLSAQPVDSHEFPFAGVDGYQAPLRAGDTTLERFAALLVPSKIPLLADGGGDGGGGSGDGGGGSGDGGGSGTGGGTGDGGSGAGAAGGTGTGGAGDGTGGTGGNGDGTGDSSSAADAAAATSDAAASTDAASTDAASTDAAATDAAAADAAATDAATADVDAIDSTAVDPTAVTVMTDPTDPTVAVNAPTVAPTDQTDVSPELEAIMSIPTTDPRGGEEVPAPVNNGAPVGAAPALGGSGAAPVDVVINAVIVSAAQSPWDAIRRAPGVRNVIITGGIIALGKTPIPGEIPGGGPQPAWLRLIPDLRLLNGSAIPPVVPNVIDVRIMNCPIKIVDPPE